MKKLVISAVGKDQSGIVAAFTKVLYENHCNVEDTSMTLLEDHFTMLFIIHAPGEVTVAHLENCFKQVLQEFNMQLVIYTIDTNRETLDTEGYPWMISVSGPDQTGIMYHVTQYLSAQYINVRHLSSKRLSRPDGETLFFMALEVDVPECLPQKQLQQDLARLAQTEQLEIHAEPMETYTL